MLYISFALCMYDLHVQRESQKQPCHSGNTIIQRCESKLNIEAQFHSMNTFSGVIEICWHLRVSDEISYYKDSQFNAFCSHRQWWRIGDFMYAKLEPHKNFSFSIKSRHLVEAQGKVKKYKELTHTIYQTTQLLKTMVRIYILKPKNSFQSHRSISRGHLF